MQVRTGRHRKEKKRRYITIIITITIVVMIRLLPIINISIVVIITIVLIIFTTSLVVVVVMVVVVVTVGRGRGRARGTGRYRGSGGSGASAVLPSMMAMEAVLGTRRAVAILPTVTVHVEIRFKSNAKRKRITTSRSSIDLLSTKISKRPRSRVRDVRVDLVRVGSLADCRIYNLVSHGRFRV